MAARSSAHHALPSGASVPARERHGGCVPVRLRVDRRRMGAGPDHRRARDPGLRGRVDRLRRRLGRDGPGRRRLGGAWPQRHHAALVPDDGRAPHPARVAARTAPSLSRRAPPVPPRPPRRRTPGARRSRSHQRHHGPATPGILGQRPAPRARRPHRAPDHPPDPGPSRRGPLPPPRGAQPDLHPAGRGTVRSRPAGGG